MVITKGYLESINAIPDGKKHFTLKAGAIKIWLRLYGNQCYCLLPGLYIGEIKSISQLESLYFGITGNQLTTAPH